MSKILRIVAATLLLAAAVSGATSKIIQVNGDGPAPVPLCDPRNPRCQLPLERPASAAPAHR